jgi:hypothetical protein
MYEDSTNNRTSIKYEHRINSTAAADNDKYYTRQHIKKCQLTDQLGLKIMVLIAAKE